MSVELFVQLENWLRVEEVIFDIHFSSVWVHMQRACKQMAGVKKITVQTIISAEGNAYPSHSECFEVCAAASVIIQFPDALRGTWGLIKAGGHRLGRKEHPFCRVKR